MDVCYFLTLLLSKHVQVEVSEGIIEGQVVDNEYGCPYYSFKGIPYAEPPVGDLRFKAPQPKAPWEGVYNATSHGNRCDSFQTTSFGSEDCLYLNVYSPNITPIDPLPVMVFIHGGAFVVGSGNEEDHGPKYLLRKDVIVVTLNYRLGILGFLSLDTEDIPGNAGMKDQVAALRWIKKNIKKFGGYPDNITLFGESAGSASVSFHLVSPMSKGLFNRAITQSGTMTSWFPITFQARDRALLLAKELGCNSTDDKEIYEFLKMQPASNLVNKQIPVSYWESAKETINVYYSVVSEKQFGDKERFFYGDTYEVLRNGIHEGVAVISGYTQDEGILWFVDNDDNRVFDQANHFLEFFVPEPYTVNIPLETQMDIGERFRNFYLKNKTASKATLDDLLKFFSMELIVYGAISQQKIIAKKNKNKTYLYKFTCHSELNIMTKLLGLEDLFDYRPVVGHADDLAYIFSNFKVDNMSQNAYKMIEQVTTLWTNFAKYGDPTPDDSLGVKWLPYTVENEDYLDIGEDLVSKTHPEKEEIEFWESNFKEFLPEYAP